MFKPLQYHLLVALGAFCVLLALALLALQAGNRGLQRLAAERAQYIQQSQAVSGVYGEVVNALATLANQHADGDLRELLAGVGVNVAAAQPMQSGSAR